MQGVAREKRESVDEGGKNGKDGPHGEYVVEVGYDVVCVVENNIKG